jgi:predicted aspartyl protease
MPKFSSGFLAMALLAPLAAYADDAPCKMPLVRFMKIDMNMDASGGVNIPVTIGGKPEQLLVDTGGFLSMLTPGAEDGLGLKRINTPNSVITGWGGWRTSSYVRVPDITLGTLKLPAADILTMPDGRLPGDLDGTLAPDMLSVFDVDFDFAGGKLSFFSQQHCPGKVVYWTHDPHAELPMIISHDGHIQLTLQLDGEDVLTTIDTGSSDSEMSLETAERLFDFDEKSPLLKTLSEDAHSRSYRYPFKNITLQGVTVRNPDLILVPDDESRVMDSGWDYHPPKLILGMNILRQLHMYIAYKEKMIYVTSADAHLPAQ